MDCRISFNFAAFIRRVLRQYNGSVPDEQLISEAALALAIHRRGLARAHQLVHQQAPPGACRKSTTAAYGTNSRHRRWRTREGGLRRSDVRREL